MKKTLILLMALLLIGTAGTRGELVQAILRDASGQELASIADS